MKTKIKYLGTFWVKTKNFYQNLVFALKKLVFCCPDPGSGLGKKSWIWIRKKLIQIRNTTKICFKSFLLFQVEIRNFVKEFETKRQDTEVENIFGVLERVSELRLVIYSCSIGSLVI